jgi:hypothetical protein
LLSGHIHYMSEKYFVCLVRVYTFQKCFVTFQPQLNPTMMFELRPEGHVAKWVRAGLSLACQRDRKDASVARMNGIGNRRQ